MYSLPRLSLSDTKSSPARETAGSARRRHTSVALCCLALGAACSAPAPAPGESDEPGNWDESDTRAVELDQPGVPDQVLAEVDVGYGRVWFHGIELPDGNLQVVQSEAAPNNVGDTPFGALVAEGHTALELFLSIAPGRTPPPVLKALHASEAAELARPDAAVIPGRFETQVTVQKSAEACDAFVYEDISDTESCERYWGNGRIATITSGSKGLHVGQFWDYSTTRRVTLGICNESDTTIRGRIGYDLGGDRSSSYTYRTWATIDAGGMHRWHNFRRVEQCPCQSGPGFACTVHDCYEPTRYRVDGDAPRGARYLLRTAEAQSSCPPSIGGLD